MCLSAVFASNPELRAAIILILNLKTIDMQFNKCLIGMKQLNELITADLDARINAIGTNQLKAVVFMLAVLSGSCDKQKLLKCAA